MIVLSLFDLTGIMVQPWARAGHECICVDNQHPADGKTDGNITFINLDLSYRSSAWDTLCESLENLPIIIFGFPPCTDLAASGAMHWQTKKIFDPAFQDKALDMVINVEKLANKLGVPYMIENPRGTLSLLWRKPDFEFDPCDYGGYLPANDKHPQYPDYIPSRDAYTKRTCIWFGNGFVVPEKIRVEPEFYVYRKRDGRITKVSKPAAKLGGGSFKTKNIRSATPRGFAMAVYCANGAGRGT